MPNYLGGIHRDKVFTINAFPLMLDDEDDTTTVRVGKCGMFTDTYESSVFDGCSNLVPFTTVYTNFIFDTTTTLENTFTKAPHLGESFYKTMELRPLLDPGIQDDIRDGIPTVPTPGSIIEIEPTPPILDDGMPPMDQGAMIGM